NLKNQIMTTNLWVEQSWYDYKLRWEPKEYGGVHMLHVPSDHIWRPDIVLYNNADGNYEVTLMTKATVYYNGMVVWQPPAVYKSSCSIDVEFFPYDVQTCVLKLGSWTYDGFKVDLRHMDEQAGSNIVSVGVDLSEFYMSVEWDILEVPAVRLVRHERANLMPYLDITFNITMRRKTLFYTVNIIIPCMGISFLTVLTFYLPSDSGEKVTLSISILISLHVFFLLVVEIIPPTSLVVPLLGKYLIFAMILVSISICVTVVVLNVHFRSPQTHRMAPWVKRVFIHILPRLLFMKRPQYKFDTTSPKAPVLLNERSDGNADHLPSIVSIDTEALMNNMNTKFEQLTRDMVELRNSFNNRIDGLATAIQVWASKFSLLDDTVRSMQTDITVLSNNSDEMRAELSELQSETVGLRSENQQLRKIISECDYKKGLNDAKETIERLSKENNDSKQFSMMNNLEISGIPYNKGENLLTILHSMSVKVGFTMQGSDVDTIHRVRRYQSNVTGSQKAVRPPAIIVRFTQRKRKDEFLSAIRARRGITTADIELPGPASNVYVSDHLTPENKLLLKRARQIKIDLQYTYLWTRDCKIQMRKRDNSKAAQADYDFIGISETWLTADFYDREYFDSRYSVYRCDRSIVDSGAARGGGVVLAVRAEYRPVRRDWPVPSPAGCDMSDSNRFGGSCVVHGSSEGGALGAAAEEELSPVPDPPPGFSHSSCPPEVHRTCFCVRFIAEHTRMLEDSTKVKEDWKYVAMVLDRLFLWIFTLAVLVGTAGIILQAPTLYDDRVPIDKHFNQIATSTLVRCPPPA
ncbi:hypothetical protein MSG28_002892, partial [Choristoneura fumiferana]